MKLVDCRRCGSKELVEENGLIVCVFCQSKYVPQVSDMPPRDTVIGIAADIQALLQQCRDEPINRRRLAGLVLDIDPTNREAQQYLL